MYKEYSKEQLNKELEEIKAKYQEYKDMNLSLNMARGVPSKEQLDLSRDMLDLVDSKTDCMSDSGINAFSYGTLDGLPEAKKLLAGMMDVDPDYVFVGGNSSLNLMFDAISSFMYKSPVEGEKPWAEIKDRKFICPCPGYDRHFNLTGYFGFEMIVVPMTESGPDMDKVEELVKDPSVKGMWCVPKYSNPQGITYSDETVRRIANLKPAAKDFRVMWDNAYCIHDISDTKDELLSLWDESKKANNEDIALYFCSTSKVTFPGSGISGFACSENNMKYMKQKYTFETIGYDKINMLRHVKFFKDIDAMKAHMEKHKALLKPRFDIVCDTLEKDLVPFGIVKYKRPNGGYFVSVDVADNTAKRVVELCKECGVTLTGAGATYPHKNDPKDSNIRIAPTFPSTEDLQKAIEIFCVCAKYAYLEKNI